MFFGLIGVTVIGVIVAFAFSRSSGWAPSRESAAVVLPLYFATMLGVLALSFIVSGNTLMHHYRTGTVQRATNPVWFWCIVTVQSLIAVALLIFGCMRWNKWY